MNFPRLFPGTLGAGALADPIWQAASCWAFIGEAGGVPIAWSTEPVEGFDARLIEPPAAWTLGPSMAASGTPELASSSLTVDNADASLNRLLLGIPAGSSDVAEEYQGASVLDLRGALHLVSVTESGSVVTRQMSPPMRVSGPVTTSPGRITLSLTADGDAALGRVRGLRSLREWGTEEIANLSLGSWVEQQFSHDPSGAPWDLIRHLSDQALETLVPWSHGGAPLRLIPLQESGLRIYLGGLRAPAPDQSWSLDHVRLVSPDGDEIPATPYEMGVQFSDPSLPLLLLYLLPDSEDMPTDLWAVPAQRTPRSPAEIMRALLAAQAPEGLDAVDTVSLDATGPGLRHLDAALAGVVEGETTISEIMEHACPAIGWRTWIGIDGKLHFALRDPPRSEWEGKPPAAVLYPPDDYPITTDGVPSWTETVPTDPDAVGAPVGRVSIDWSQWATEVYPHFTRPSISAMDTQAQQRGGEARLSGAWVHPDAGATIVSLAADRAAYPIRTISMATGLELVNVPIGSYLEMSSDWAHVIGGFGVDARLTRLVRVEVRPADMCTVITLEDMGAVAAMRVGLLDSRENWERPRSSGTGIVLETRVVSGQTVGLITGLHVSPLVDETIWAAPSTHPDRLGECSYRIIGPLETGYQVDPPPTPTPAETQAVPDGEWRWMRTYTTGGKILRPDRIAAASDTAQRFTDTDPPFRFVRI